MKHWYYKEKFYADHSYGDVTRHDSQRRFLAQHSVATFLRHCFESFQHCSDIASLSCAKTRRCELSRVTSPLGLIPQNGQWARPNVLISIIPVNGLL